MPETTAKITTWLFEKLVVPVPPEELKTTGYVQ
jgi:hypothetical protein